MGIYICACVLCLCVCVYVCVPTTIFQRYSNILHPP